jgi:magnesium chelatase family protein
VPGVKFKDIVSKAEGESSMSIRERVVRARKIQLARFAARKIFANAQMGPKEVKAFCRIEKEGERLLEAA